MKHLKRTLSILLAMLMLLTMVPMGIFTVSAAGLTVYVGGKTLADGNYLTNSGSTVSTKPSGGYAYYKDGVLTLNNYTYDGAGCDVPEHPGYTALVYSKKALTVKLVGTNTLTNSIESISVGIWVENEALTIIDGGSGALNMTVKDDGIHADDDDINIQGGIITITADDCGIYTKSNLTISGGKVTVNSGNDGIYGRYNVDISGGTVTITADYCGIYTKSNLTISGGKVTVNSGNDGICAYYNVDISGGTVTVTAEGDGIYSGDDTTISGGIITVTAEDDGIYSNDNLTISGGTITITADDYGIWAIDAIDHVTISGGTVTVNSGNDGICAHYNLDISGGTLNVTADSSGIYAYDNLTISGGDVTVKARYYALYAHDDDLTITGGNLDLTTTDTEKEDYDYYSLRSYFGNIVIGDGVKLSASTEPDGTLVSYVAANKYTYDRVITCDHVYSNACDTTCNRCGATRTPSAHKGGTATCKVKAKCSVCGKSYGSLKSHSYEKKTTKATLTKDGIIKNVCKTCGYTASKTTTIYKASSVKLSKTSYTYNGKVQKPTVVVKDSKGNTISSSHYTVTYPSGMKNAGTYKVTVKFKGNYSGTKTLSYTIKPIDISKCKITLSTTSYTYNGSAKKPAVTVKNASGTKLTTSSYTVTYASGRKNVGKYKVTIKMKGNYTGTKTLYFKINPPKTTVKSLTAGSKKLTVNITKKSTQVTGYQIQYSTSKSFKSYKTKTVSSYKTTKTTLTGLKAKTTYYVRIRTYKTVNGVKYYSGWSEIKYKKTK